MKTKTRTATKKNNYDGYRYTIEYQGIEYLVREAYIPGIGLINIGEGALGDALIDDDPNSKETFTSKEAMYIDERIYCYMPKDVLLQSDRDVLMYFIKYYT